MKHKLFSVYDSKANAYLPPFTLAEEAMAIRTFSNCANDSGHAFCKNAADYTLFNIGAFDDASGQIIGNKSIINLGNAIEFQTDEANT